jgi:hypothetical protein
MGRRKEKGNCWRLLQALRDWRVVSAPKPLETHWAPKAGAAGTEGRGWSGHAALRRRPPNANQS